MKFGFGQPASNFGKTTKDVDGFCRYQRFIVLSEIKSDTIPNILDMVFNLFSDGIDMIPSDAKKTRVLVINNSIVLGDIHGTKDTRTRSVYIHHGIADCSVDSIRGDTPIKFIDMDYNVIADKPWEVERNGQRALSDIKLSYDSQTFGGVLYRDTDKYTKIITPTPEFYDEKDMIVLSGNDEDYYTRVNENKENVYFTNKTTYENNLYTSCLNNLIDDHTKVLKVNIKIDNMTSSRNIQNIDEIESYNTFIEDVCAQIKYAMEICGFSSGELILDGEKGYNITDLKTYLDLNIIEKRINYQMLCGYIDELNYTVFGDSKHDYSLLIRVDYSNIRVMMVDYIPRENPGINKTDSDVHELSNNLINQSVNEMPFAFGTGGSMVDKMRSLVG